jgi:S1-C subfamily serine protease
VLIRDGVILTIGYLITEAETVWIGTNDGRALPGHVLGYDQETGFGLVQALGKLDLPPLRIGRSSQAPVGERVVIGGAGGRHRSVAAQIVAKREFAGYWEYVLDEALFTAPAHPQWGGSALIGADGRLAGIGSLLVQEKIDAGTIQGNMIVPIDLLAPILDDMTKTGRANRPTRPWLGLYATEAGERLVVAGLAPGGPAERAGVRVGDALMEVGGEKPKSLADVWRKVWAHGVPGAVVPLKLGRSGKMLELRLTSADRADFLKKPHLH